MILEGIVTTLDANGTLNVAPMGPHIEPGFDRFLLQPFRSSTTYRNLKDQGEGVFHVVDDVLLLARSTIGKVSDVPTRPAKCVRGRVLLDCCRYYEFRVIKIDEQDERVSFSAETLHRETLQEAFGFNRARHAVLETAILASRISFLPVEGIGAELRKFQVIVQKTGDIREAEAFRLLEDHIRAVAGERGLDLDTLES